MCWLVFIHCHSYMQTWNIKYCLLWYNLTVYAMQNVTVCMLFHIMRFHVQMTIYWCVTKTASGLMNSRLWFYFMMLYTLGRFYLRYLSIWTLFKLTFLWVLLFVPMIEKQQSFLILDIKLLKWCQCNFLFPPKSSVYWLTRYLCNDRNTVLECFWVGSMDRIHRATHSVKPDPNLRSARGWYMGWNASSYHRDNLELCSLIFIFSV